MKALALHRLWGLCSDELYDPFSQRPQRLPLPVALFDSLILPVPCPTFGEHFTLKAHLGGLLTYFKHKITNALTEGFNSKIQAIKADARGFRNFENYRTRILFFCGKLDMMPVVHSPLYPH